MSDSQWSPHEYERQFQASRWKLDVETGTVSRVRTHGRADVPHSNEELAALDRIRELREAEELSLLPPAEQRRRRAWARAWRR